MGAQTMHIVHKMAESPQILAVLWIMWMKLWITNFFRTAFLFLLIL